MCGGCSKLKRGDTLKEHKGGRALCSELDGDLSRATWAIKGSLCSNERAMAEGSAEHMLTVGSMLCNVWGISCQD
jgi:hypothetical protein